MTEAVSSSETSISIHHTTRCNIPEDSHTQRLSCIFLYEGRRMQHDRRALWWVSRQRVSSESHYTFSDFAAPGKTFDLESVLPLFLLGCNTCVLIRRTQISCDWSITALLVRAVDRRKINTNFSIQSAKWIWMLGLYLHKIQLIKPKLRQKVNMTEERGLFKNATLNFPLPFGLLNHAGRFGILFMWALCEHSFNIIFYKILNFCLPQVYKIDTHPFCTKHIKSI
jgi:hypothetical protein